MKVAINPGHYPTKDSGACGIRSTEAELVEKIADVVVEDLKKVGYDVAFVQENELEEICKIANDYNAEIFVSIHCNAFNHKAEGTETFFAPGSEHGYLLAKCLQHQLLAAMKSVNRGIKEANYYVLRHTNMPAALCELDFIDNPEREDYLNSHIEEMAHAIARGITDYVEELKDSE